MDRDNQTYAIGVAGGGANIDTASIAFTYIRNHLADMDIPFTPIHGVETTTDNQQRVRPASQQLAELTRYIDTTEPNAHILLIAQCLGTIAALSALEQYQSTRSIALSVFSPPLTTPRHTVSQPKSRDKRSANDTRMRIVDFAPGKMGDFTQLVETSATIPPRYLEDIDAAHDIDKRLRAATAMGNMAIFATSHDWNMASPDTIADWITADPSLPVWLLSDTGHSLNAADTSLTATQKMQRQQATCALVVDTGLSLLDRTNN